MSNTAHLIDKHEGYTIVKFNQELDYNQSKKFEADIEGRFAGCGYCDPS